MASLLDIRTLSIVMGVTIFVLGLSMVYYICSRKTYIGFGLWTAGIILVGVALVLIAFRHILPAFVTIIVANGMIFACLALLYHGFTAMAGKSVRAYFHIGVGILFLVSVSFLTYVVPSVNARISLTSFMASLYSFWCIWVLIKSSQYERGGLNKMLASTLIAFCILSACRGVFFLLPANAIDDFMSAGVFHGTALLALIVLFVIGLMQLNSQMLEREFYRDQESLRESEELLGATLESTADGILVVDEKGIVTRTNRRFARMWQIPDDLIQAGDEKRLLDYVLDQLKEPEAFLSKVQTLYKKQDEDFDVLHFKDGRVFERFSSPLIRKGRIAGRVWSFRDVTDRKQAEEALRAERERLRFLSENAPFGMAMISKDGTFRYVNPKFIEIFGYDLDDIPDGRTWFRKAYPDPDYRSQVISGWLEELAYSQVGQKRPRVLDVECKDGSKKIVSFLSVQLETGEHLLACEDITFSKQAEEALRKSEKRFRELFNSVSDLVYTQDLDGRLLSLNPAFCKTLGYVEEELLGRSVSDFMKPEFAKAFQSEYLDKIKMEGYHEGTSAYFTKYGNEIYLEYRSSIVYPEEGEPYITGIGRDVTVRLLSEKEKQKLQVQLNQAQKMESIGILAGGIAHNFNNILMGIQGRASLMMMDKDLSDPDYEHLRGIEMYVKNAVMLTRDLLGFARGGKYEVRPTDLNTLIQHENRMFGRTKKEIQIHEEYEKDLWAVEVDQGQIQQVLLNLYVNASHAMPAGGDLYIRTENVTLDEKDAKMFDIASGRYVKVSVIDTGVGMDSAIREKIFDPFFSTRDAGQGSGLGLASAYGIIKNHGGFINVYSEKGEGTTFTIYLPASEKKTMEETSRLDQVETQYGQGTLLLVDDEEMIIEVGQEILKKLGYHVMIARGGREALDLYKKHREEIDVVILDMIMPDMGGGKTFDRLKAIDGDVKVILSSGYSIDGQAQEILDRGCIGFIQKPFSMTDLSNRVRKVLDTDRG